MIIIKKKIQKLRVCSRYTWWNWFIFNTLTNTKRNQTTELHWETQCSGVIEISWLTVLLAAKATQEHKLVAVGLHAEHLNASSFIAHKQFGVARVHSHWQRVIELAVFFRGGQAANGGDELEVGIKHLNTVIASDQRRKDDLAGRWRFGEAGRNAHYQRQVVFSVPMRCCTLPSWSKINTWWSLLSLTSTWLRLLKQTCCGHFSTSWPKDRKKPSEASNTHTRLFLCVGDKKIASFVDGHSNWIVEVFFIAANDTAFSKSVEQLATVDVKHLHTVVVGVSSEKTRLAVDSHTPRIFQLIVSWPSAVATDHTHTLSRNRIEDLNTMVPVLAHRQKLLVGEILFD